MWRAVSLAPLPPAHHRGPRPWTGGRGRPAATSRRPASSSIRWRFKSPVTKRVHSLCSAIAPPTKTNILRRVPTATFWLHSMLLARIFRSCESQSSSLLLLLAFGCRLADRLLCRDLTGDGSEDVRHIAYHERRRAVRRAM